ncbi:YjbF family lipoprotein [uncultured Halopseudomonas sp.]|uniref:YjbF family lipoprotein n=1 Tax=uncultured Halopseudomonas sp. TaxID=2901193 RepID=UPI0030EE2982
MNNLSRLGACCLAALLLPGCNSLMNDSYQTIKLAISGPEPLVTAEYVNTLGRPGLVVRLAQSEALLVRAAENRGVAEWHGLEQMLVTHNGRVVQGAGLPDASDLVAPLTANDPFSNDLRQIGLTEVVRLVDFPERFLTGIPQISTYELGPLEGVEVMGAELQLQRLDEYVSMPAIGFSATNFYWFEPATGRVVASRQHLAPGLPPMRLIEVRPVGFEE